MTLGHALVVTWLDIYYRSPMSWDFNLEWDLHYLVTSAKHVWNVSKIELLYRCLLELGKYLKHFTGDRRICFLISAIFTDRYVYAHVPVSCQYKSLLKHLDSGSISLAGLIWCAFQFAIFTLCLNLFSSLFVSDKHKPMSL